MALPFLVDGAQTVIPGIYDTFRVASSIPAPVPAGRAVFIFGESEEGIPGSDLDLKNNFFTDFQSVKDFYRTGPIVDAARMLFSNQPSPVFGGAIQRLYVYKTNATTRAEKEISSPANYGSIVAARYGERGNLIKSQIKTGQIESKPSKSALYLASSVARAFKASANGVLTGTASLSADQVGSDFQIAFDALTGVAASGGTARTVNSATVTVDITSSGDILTLTKVGGTGDFGSDAQVGDSVYIQDGLAIAGTGDANAGAYIVAAWSTTAVSLRQIKHIEAAGEANVEAFDNASGVILGIGDLKVNAPLTLSIDATTLTGQGASLEFFEDSAANKLAAGMLFNYDDLANILALSTSSIAKISTTIPSAGKLKIQLDKGSWTVTPSAGDIIRIPRGSLIAGATNKNVGLMIVESATSQSITASHLFSGMTTEAVAAVNLASVNDPFQWAAGWVSSDVAAIKLDSSAERKVQIIASRSSDGAQFPATLIGGNVALEVSYNHASATAAVLSIDANRIMTIDVTGTGLSDLTINTKKYATLQDLVDFLNTQANISARVANPNFKSLPYSALDMVTNIGILGGHALAAYNGKIKKDYYDWKAFLDANFGLIAFKEGSLNLKAGLPDAESSASFLSGGEIGASSNASIQNALDEALKISVRFVVPLFSRDASFDILDGLTDAGSTYTIDSIHAAAIAHVSTASSSLFKKERFAMLSFDGDFEDAKLKAGNIGYERAQMLFQRHNATNGEGSSVKQLPWIAACAVTAGRAQAALGISMLRKPFLLSSAEHTGEDSLFSDIVVPDFDPEDRGELEEAITAGLLVFRAVPGFGVRMESPDLSTRSRVNDPEGWLYERVNVYFVTDEVRDTMRTTLENFIGNRTSDVSTAVVKTAMQDVINSFIASKALLSGEVTSVVSLGNQYKAQVIIRPTEALEAIVLDVVAERVIG